LGTARFGKEEAIFVFVVLRRDPVTVPNYKTIDRSLLKKILRDAGLTVEEFESRLD
jgi:beta-lactam-binding protein with PASTA domain